MVRSSFTKLGQVISIQVIRFMNVGSFYQIVIATGSSVSRDIEFGQRYNLPNWINSSVTDDDTAPANGFVFNNGVLATPVVALRQISADGGSGNNLPSSFSCLFHKVDLIN